MYIQVLILCFYACMAADVLSVLFSKGNPVAFHPGESVHSDLPCEIQTKCFLNAKPELSTADETCLMVHSDKAWIISTFFSFRLLSEIPDNSGFLRLGRWKMWEDESMWDSECQVSACNSWEIFIDHKIYVIYFNALYVLS